MGKLAGVNKYKHLGILCSVLTHAYHDLASKAQIAVIVYSRSLNDPSPSLYVLACLMLIFIPLEDLVLNFDNHIIANAHLL